MFLFDYYPCEDSIRCSIWQIKEELNLLGNSKETIFA